MLFGEYLRSWTNLNDTIEDELNIDGCYVFKVGVILNE